MKSRRHQRVVATLATIAAAGVLLALAATVSAATTLKIGTYSGKSSQKVKLGFELAHSTVNCPNGGKAKFCLYQLDSQAEYLTLKCPGGATDSVGELINPVIVPKSHVLQKSIGQEAVAGRLTYHLKVEPSGKITGWFKDSFKTAGTPVCRSGRVTFTAKRTGRVKQ